MVVDGGADSCQPTEQDPKGARQTPVPLFFFGLNAQRVHAFGLLDGLVEGRVSHPSSLQCALVGPRQRAAAAQRFDAAQFEAHELVLPCAGNCSNAAAAGEARINEVEATAALTRLCPHWPAPPRRRCQADSCRRVTAPAARPDRLPRAPDRWPRPTSAGSRAAAAPPERAAPRRPPACPPAAPRGPYGPAPNSPGVPECRKAAKKVGVIVIADPGVDLERVPRGD